jgi:hypothetical protein
MENITLSSVLQHENLHDIFQLPLSEEAYVQYCEVSVLIQSVQDNTDNDKWKYIWGNVNFSAKKRPTIICQDLYQCIQHFVGFGIHQANQNIKCSFSFS